MPIAHDLLMPGRPALVGHPLRPGFKRAWTPLACSQTGVTLILEVIVHSFGDASKAVGILSNQH